MLASADVRDAILDSAEQLLARYGYRKMTMDDLAREAGIGKGTTYLHFPSKQEVILRSIDRIVERLLKELRVIAESDAPPADRVRQMLVARVLFRFDSVKGYSQGLDDVLRALRPAYLARRQRYFAAEAAVIAEVLRDGKVGGMLTVKDPLTTAHTLLLATNSLLPYSLSRGELGKRKEVEERARQIADLLLDGLRRRADRAVPL
jgi:AcrR family transcriptional regulator